MQQLHDLLGMPPEFAGANSEPKVVQGFAAFHVCLPLISKFSGLDCDFGVNASKFSGMMFFGRRGFGVGGVDFRVEIKSIPIGDRQRDAATAAA